MKKINLLLLLPGFAFYSFSQIDQGTIIYEISGQSTALEGAITESNMVFYFMPGKTRSDVSTSAINTVIITDEQVGKVLELASVGEMKLASKTEYSRAKDEQEFRKHAKVELVNEQKEILGYVCSKVLLTSAEGAVVEVWYTKDITASPNGKTFYNPLIPGFPLSLKFEKDSMKVEYTAVKIEETVDPNLFSLIIPAGYTTR